MTPVVQQVLDAAEAQLRAALEPAGVQVFANRATPVPREARPAVVVTDGDEGAPDGDDFEPTTAIDFHAVEMQVFGYVAARDSEIRAAREGLRGQVLQALLADTTLGGRALDLDIGPTERALDDHEGRGGLAAFLVQVTAVFTTAQDDPFTADQGG